VIGRVLPRGKRVQDVLRYLYKTGEDSRHVDPRVIGSWRHPIDVEPPVTAAGKRDFRPLTALLEQPLAIRDADRRPRQPVWHCVLRTTSSWAHEIHAPQGPQLSPVCEMGAHGSCRSYMPVPGMPDPPPWPERCPCECHRPSMFT
jgi:hypothetical protein